MENCHTLYYMNCLIYSSCKTELSYWEIGLPLCAVFLCFYMVQDHYLIRIWKRLVLLMYKNQDNSLPVSQDNSLPVSLKQDNNNIPKLSVEKDISWKLIIKHSLHINSLGCWDLCRMNRMICMVNCTELHYVEWWVFSPLFLVKLCEMLCFSAMHEKRW